MANKKRRDVNTSIELGRIKWTTEDILAIEDILKKHARFREEYEFKNERRSAKKGEKDEVSIRETTDVHIEFNTSLFGGRGLLLGFWSIGYASGVSYDNGYNSIGDMPKGVRPHYLRVNDGVDVLVTFSPMKTTIHAKRVARSPELRKSIDKAVERIQKRLTRSKQRERHRRTKARAGG